MSEGIVKAMSNLYSNVSFGGGGGGGGGGRAQTGIGVGVGYQTVGRTNPTPSRNAGPTFERTGRNPTPSRSWSQDFSNCVRTNDTWHGSETPATDTVLGCAATTTINHW